LNSSAASRHQRHRGARTAHRLLAYGLSAAGAYYRSRYALTAGRRIAGVTAVRLAAPAALHAFAAMLAALAGVYSPTQGGCNGAIATLLLLSYSVRTFSRYAQRQDGGRRLAALQSRPSQRMDMDISVNNAMLGYTWLW